MYTANSDHTKPKHDKEDQNQLVILIKSVDMGGRDDFGLSQKRTQDMSVNYAPIPITWTTPITAWSMRRMVLHLAGAMSMKN